MSDSFRQNFQPPSDMHPADWAAMHVMVENSERGAKFDPSQTRWWRKPMGCYSDYDTTNLVCIMPTGAGKSTFYEAINCWIVAESPGSVLYASQTDSDAQLWAETRFMKAAQKCKPLDHLWPSNLRNAVRKDAIIWPHMFMVIGGANRSNFQEKSITYGQGDESWCWKRGMVKEWLARSHNRESRKFSLVSQAGKIAGEDETGETCELHQEHDKCRKWDFGWQCKCGSAQPYAFDQLKFDEVKRANGTIDDQQSADTVRRVCPSCSEEYLDTPEARRMLHDSLEENDGYILTSSDGRRGYEGFHVDRGAMWWCKWSDDVMKKLAADRQLAMGDDSGIAEWTMKDRALGYSPAQSVAKIELPRSGYTLGDYEEARKIDGEQCRFMTVDPGGDHFWVEVRAWAQGGPSRGLYVGYVNREQDLCDIEAKYGVPKNCVFLDIGFNQTDMAEIIARNGWRGIKGKMDNGDNIKDLFDWEIGNTGRFEKRLYSKKKFTKSKSGKIIEYYHVSTERLQYILQRLIEGKGAEWLMYDDAPPSYSKHLNGERLVTVTNAKGREVKKWKRFGANHSRDLEIYQLAASFMFKCFKPATKDLKDDDSD
jgi:phage terminase large subunit GpA-like protein